MRSAHRTIVFISDPVYSNGVLIGRDFANGDNYRYTTEPDGRIRLTMNYGGKTTSRVLKNRSAGGRIAGALWREEYGAVTDYDLDMHERNDRDVLERQTRLDTPKENRMSSTSVNDAMMQLKAAGYFVDYDSKERIILVRKTASSPPTRLYATTAKLVSERSLTRLLGTES